MEGILLESGGAIEHQDSGFDVETLFSSPADIDWGIPMSPPSPPPLPLLPSSHMNKEEDVVAQSSAQAAGKKIEQDLELPDFTCTPSDVELVQDYLRPAIQRMPPEDLCFVRSVVNADLPSMDPWELPGIAGNNKGGMRDKYYLTDNCDLSFFVHFRLGVRTTNGFWHRHAHDTVIRAGHNGVVGTKKTMKFHTYTGTKTNWVMNVYHSRNDRNLFLQDDLVLCHVFETDSPDYDGNPKCLGCEPGACSGHHHDQAFGAPSEDTSFNSTQPGYRPMHYYPKRPSDPRLKSYITLFENVLLGDPDDPDNSADTGNCSATRGDPPTVDHGQSKKRKKRSDVWDYFTKIFARDINGKVLTFAACNHCCKILSGSSKNGTSQLARHACPCKFKPVAAGRNAKDSGGDVSVLWS